MQTIRYHRGFPLGIAASLLLALAGCSLLPEGVLWIEPDSSEQTEPSSGAVAAVGVNSDGLVLEAGGAGMPPERLLAEVSGLLAEKKTATARRLVQTHPETAWQLLRGPVPVGDAKTLGAIAAAHDAQCVRADGVAGWQALLADRTQRPVPYQRYAQRRAEFLDDLRHGFPGRALARELVPPAADALPSLVAVDAWQLTGTALLLDDRPGDAAAAYQRAVMVAERSYPYYEAHLRLQWSEALRSAGRIAEADAAWGEAVRCAGAGLRADPPRLDPEYWQRAAGHRGVDRPWPAELIATLAELTLRYGLSAGDGPWMSGGSEPTSERFLWACMGHWWLERGEPQAALVALKRAHGLTAAPRDRLQLELAQAKALTALDQTAAATGILASIADSPDPSAQVQALATLGSLRLATGGTKQGFHLLRRALEQDDSIDWPSRARAEADLGLAYLMLGNEQAGLQWLHRAQARFQSSGTHDHLLQSLENELAYAEQAKNKSQARALRQRIEELEAAG